MITLDNKRIEEFGFHIEPGMDDSITPNFERKTMSISGRSGVIPIGTEIKEKYFSYKLKILERFHDVMQSKFNDFSAFLFDKDGVPRKIKLIRDYDPTKIYYVELAGPLTPDRGEEDGTLVVTFVAHEAHGQGNNYEVTAASVTNEPVYVDVKGSYKTSPIIEFDVDKDITELSIVTGDDYIRLGEALTVDKTSKDINPSVLADTFTGYTGWTKAPSLEDGYIVQGDFVSDGNYLTQKDNFGNDTTGWHGASAIKSFSRATQDFEVKVTLALKSLGSPRKLGAMGFYILDENNTRIAKVVFHDSYLEMDSPTLKVTVGTSNNEYVLTHTPGTFKGTWSEFYGFIKVGRTGNFWWAYIAMQDEKNSNGHTAHYKDWIASSGITTSKAAKIQIFNLQFKQELAHWMMFDDVQVNEFIKKQDNQVPILFKKNDHVIIDFQKCAVYKNGELIMDKLDPFSSFFDLHPGQNGLAFSSPIKNLKINYQERWL